MIVHSDEIVGKAKFLKHDVGSWNTGSLLNLGWGASAYLAPVLLICALLTVLMIRPLELLALEEHGGRSLGVPMVTVRLTGLLLAVVLASVTITAVGVIGFVGIAAPAIARLARARTFRQRVVATPLLGSILLWLADQITQINPLLDNELPTGVLTAIFGGALLLWMLPRLHGASLGDAGVSLARRNVTKAPCIAFAVWAVLLVIIIGASLLSAQSLDGWLWQGVSDGNAAFEWRWPRVAASAIAGAMLAVSGAIIQRVTGNAMASPEILGISSGAGLGVALLFLFDLASGHALKVSAASGGAFLTLALSFTLARNASASPERMLLTGMALATVFGALLSAITARFYPRVAGLLSWLAGSTYSVTIFDILALASVPLGVTAILPLTLRWLEILPLGDVTARQIGVNVGASRLTLLLIASLLTGTAVLTIGPLSFVGVIAPHLARMTGGRNILSQLIISAILGATSWFQLTGLAEISCFRMKSPLARWLHSSVHPTFSG